MTKKKRKQTKLGDREIPKFYTERVYEDEDGEEVAEAITVDLNSDLDINEFRLDDEIRDQSKLYGWYIDLKTDAQSELEHARSRVSCLKEDLMGKFRTNEQALPIAKRLNETQMKAKINRQPKVRAALKLQESWADRSRKLEGYCAALEMRHRNLQSLNASRNSEYGQTKH